MHVDQSISIIVPIIYHLLSQLVLMTQIHYASSLWVFFTHAGTFENLPASHSEWMVTCLDGVKMLWIIDSVWTPISNRKLQRQVVLRRKWFILHHPHIRNFRTIKLSVLYLYPGCINTSFICRSKSVYPVCDMSHTGYINWSFSIHNVNLIMEVISICYTYYKFERQ